MWITFHSIEKKDDLVSKRTGSTYSAYVMQATKKGFGGAKDEEYQKIFFDNSSCTIIEHGRKRPNKNIVQYLKKTADDGDTIIIRNVRNNKGSWDIESMENISKHSSTGSSTTYEPLSEAEVEEYANRTSSVESEPQFKKEDDDLPWVV